MPKFFDKKIRRKYFDNFLTAQNCGREGKSPLPWCHS